MAVFLLSVFLFGLLGNIEPHRTFANWKFYFHHLHVKRLIAEFFLLKQPTYLNSFSTLHLKNIVNGSLWTIQFEGICYLLLPVLAMAGALKRKWISLALFLFFYTIMQLQTYQKILLLAPHPGFGIPDLLDVNYIPNFFAYFFAGMCVYLYRNSIPRSFMLMALSATLLMLSSVVYPVFNLVFPIAGTYLLFYFAYSSKIRLHHFAKKGDLSYGVYLYAFPIQQLVLYFLSPGIGLYQFFILSLLITLLTARYWSWECVEKPFIELKKKG
jgi:peptidoglycan/LPS O-acetylase OafA/YrhL